LRLQKLNDAFGCVARDFSISVNNEIGMKRWFVFHLEPWNIP